MEKTGHDYNNSKSRLRHEDLFLFRGGWKLFAHQRCNLLRKIGISKLQPYATVSNLFTFTKYLGFDPEVNQWGNSGNVQGIDYGTYPQTRSFIFGVNLDI